MAAKYYAVKVGKTPGIYRSWDECKVLVNGFPGAIYKSFKTETEAIEFMGEAYSKSKSAKQEENIAITEATNQEKTIAITEAANQNETITTTEVVDKSDNTQATLAKATNSDEKAYAFVDGSYNVGTAVYGYGGFVVYDGDKHIVTGNGNDAEMASMRNVAGEVLGSMAAVKKAIELGIKEIDIYYDYMGIEMWATGAWKRNKKGTIAYYEFMQSIKNKIKVNFVKVKGHSGVDGNEEADILAKKAVNIL